MLLSSWNVYHLKWMHILSLISNMAQSKGYWQAWWMENSEGIFTMKWTYHIMTTSRANLEWVNYLRIKGLPLKLHSFFGGFGRKEFSMITNSLQIHIFCVKGETETMTHLFVISLIGHKLLSQYVSCASFDIEVLHLHIVIKWCELKENTKI